MFSLIQNLGQWHGGGGIFGVAVTDEQAELEHVAEF